MTSAILLSCSTKFTQLGAVPFVVLLWKISIHVLKKMWPDCGGSVTKCLGCQA